MAGLHECDLLPELVSSTLIVGVPASRTPEGVWVSTLRVLLVRWGVSGIGARCPSGISIFLIKNNRLKKFISITMKFNNQKNTISLKNNNPKTTSQSVHSNEDKYNPLIPLKSTKQNNAFVLNFYSKKSISFTKSYHRNIVD